MVFRKDSDIAEKRLIKEVVTEEKEHMHVHGTSTTKRSVRYWLYKYKDGKLALSIRKYKRDTFKNSIPSRRASFRDHDYETDQSIKLIELDDDMIEILSDALILAKAFKNNQVKSIL